MKKTLLIISTLFLICTSCSKTVDSLPSNEGNTEALITSADIRDIDNNSVLLSSEIDTATSTVTIIPKDGIDKRNLKLFATLSDGALSKPVNGTLIDFSNPVTFTVMSESRGTTRDWTIIVITKNEEAFIKSIEDVTNHENNSVLTLSEIDEENRAVAITVKEGTDLENLKLLASISAGASIEPAMDVLTDFSNSVEYTVTSEDGETVNKWLVSVVAKEFIDDDSGFDYDLDPTDWILNDAKSDHFDSRNETDWIFSQTSSGNFDYDLQNILVTNGKLRITVNTHGERYTSGKIKSVFEIGENSYVKIRAKMVNNKAAVNSSMVLGSPNAGITLTETLKGKPNAFTTSLKQGASPAIGSKTTSTDADLSGDYHVYGLERRNEYLRFFFDGEVVWEFETAQYPDLSKQLLNLIIGIDAVEDTQPNGVELPGYLLVDYVEVYDAVNTSENVPTYGNNLVKNPGFESEQGNDSPEGWTVTRQLTSPSSPSDVWTFRDGHGSKESLSRFHIGEVENASYCDYTISQNVSKLPDGLYRLEVWAYMLEGYTEFDPLPRLFAREHGGSKREIRIDNIGPDFNQGSWKKYVINNIYVSNGSCEIGVQAIANGKAQLFLDDFSFVKVDY